MDQTQSRGRAGGDDFEVRAGSGAGRNDAGGPALDPAGAAESLGPLISGLIGDLQELVRGEVALAKTELKQDASALGRGVGMLAAAAFLGLTGFIFVALAATYLLTRYMRDWFAAGLVALALLALAGILALVGKNQLSAANLKPEQTIETLKEDKEWASHQISSVKR